MANPEHVEIVKRGADALREWSKKNPDVQLDLSGAILRRADLTRADFSRADLRRVRDEKLRVWYAPEDMKGGRKITR